MSVELVRDFLRSWPLHILTGALFLAVVLIAPQQAGILVYKGTLIFGGAIGAYWINRVMFNRPPPNKRDETKDDSGGERTAPAIPSRHAKTVGSIFGPRTVEERTERDLHADYQLCAMVCAAMVACALAA